MGEFGKGPGKFDNPVSLNIDQSSDYLYDDISGAQLHEGEKNTNGDVVADLAAGEKVEGSISSSDLMGPLEGKPLKDIIELMEKGSIYVNLHSTTFPDGEIRGQVKSVKSAPSSSTGFQSNKLSNDGQSSPPQTAITDKVLPTTTAPFTTNPPGDLSYCDFSSYPDFCIAPPPPSLNCDDVAGKDFTVSISLLIPLDFILLGRVTNPFPFGVVTSQSYA